MLEKEGPAGNRATTGSLVQNLASHDTRSQLETIAILRSLRSRLTKLVGCKPDGEVEIQGYQNAATLRVIAKTSAERRWLPIVDSDRPSPVESDGRPAIQAALDYASRRWPVFPVYEAVNRVCACRRGSECSNPGKHPRTRHGLKDATTDLQQIQDWWRAWPQANVGIATGPAGLVVLDIDGEERGGWLHHLIEEFDVLPEQPVVLTRRGCHLYFRQEPNGPIRNAAGCPAPGLDIRATGGYVIAPPSTHASGHTYCWEPVKAPWDADLPEVPHWLARLITAAPDGLRPLAPKPAAPIDAHWGPKPAYSKKALDGAYRRITQAPFGSQETTLNAEAYAIGRLVGSGYMPHGIAEDLLIHAGTLMSSEPGRRRWTRPEIQQKVSRAMAQGLARPYAPTERGR